MRHAVLPTARRRTVTSFYSNLVTRPTGRAVRMGVESQLSELEPGLKDRLIAEKRKTRDEDMALGDLAMSAPLIRAAGTIV